MLWRCDVRESMDAELSMMGADAAEM